MNEMNKKQIESFQEGTLEHISVFNDAVLAIIITVMVLEVPYPGKGGVQYSSFIEDVILFLISFL